MRFLGPLAFTAALATGVPGQAAEGVDRTTVRFSQVAALEGPAAALGQGMRQGILAAFEEANRNGGVHGRKILLDSVNDSYEPDRSVEEVERIIEENQHIGFIGMVGTPTLRVTQPVASNANMPVIGPLTGADFLRAPWSTNVFNIRGSYAAEAETWVSHLVDTLGKRRIAILYQNDAFGQTGVEAVRAALKRRDLDLIAQEHYVRNTTAVKVAVLKLRKAAPDAVVLVGAYKPVAAFIRLARYHDFNPVFINISFVGAKALAGELGKDGEDVIVSQVVPFPWADTPPLVAQYRAALTAVEPDAEPGFVSLEGYIVGRVALTALDAAGPWLTRDTYMQALSALGTFDLGGLRLAYGPGENQGLDDIFLTRINADGGFDPIVSKTQDPDS